jgi:hypothetical protein
MFDALINQARSALAGAEPADVADAARQHVEETDPATLRQHLTDGAQGMDTGSLAQLGSALLGALQQHGASPEQAEDAGVPVAAAAQGDQESVVALIQHVAQNPAALRTAAVQLVSNDPQVLTQLPGLVSGVLSKLR